jgi:Glycosyl transferase family 11
VIVVKLMGGLGNQLFQYAAGKALALKHSTQLTLDTSFLNESTQNAHTKRELELQLFFTEYQFCTPKELNAFKNTSFLKNLVNKFAPLKSINYITLNEDGFGFNIRFFSCPKNTYLNGYWQSERYFISIRNILLKELVIKKELPSNCLPIKTAILESNSVSLHIRRGDYISDKNANAFHGILPLDYYYRGITYLNKKYKNLKVFVFSDDIPWAKENLKLLNDCVFVNVNTHENSVYDLYLMSICEHNIIANSSFSWWGAWLNQNQHKTVIAPKHWFAKKNINTTDILPNSWIILE